jgi:hypothetical protein
MLRGAALLACAACVTSTSRYYVPSAGQTRITPEEFRERAHALLGIECARLLDGAPTTSGAAVFATDLDPSGDVVRVRADRSTGDPRTDDILGGLASQLRLPAGPKHASVVANYSCSAGGAVVSVDVR